MPAPQSNRVFDYKVLRLMVGIIAFALPIFVLIIPMEVLSSISSSYHSNARDVFVGCLFFISAFLFAYNGLYLGELIMSKIVGIALIMVALFPTACDGCEANTSSWIHLGSAATAFITLSVFCFWPFRLNIKGQGGKKRIRSIIYIVCGSVMSSAVLALILVSLLMTPEAREKINITYWLEFVALWAFGVSWIVSGRYISFLFEEDEEQLALFRGMYTRMKSRYA